MIGSQPYSDASTARDSWITAIFTFGEGYHNFHHWKPGDYRNGPKFYNWDPPKWFIRAMSWIGQTWDLQKSPEEALAKAMVEMQRKRIEAHGVTWSDRLEERFSVFMKEVDELTKRRRAWMEAKRDVSTQVLHVEVKMLRERFEEARKRYREAHREWRYSLRQLNQASPAAV
jgi:stearoyl-CoA desaturase (delta-9 desaturase)